MISFKSSFENPNVIPNPKPFSWIATSVAEAAADNLNGIKTLLVYGGSACFIYGKLPVINGLRKWRNPPSWLTIFSSSFH